MDEVGIHDDVEENGTTFAENAALKARTVFDQCGIPTLADDSGLIVDALDGAPGIYSARYAKHGDSDANINKLLKNMENVPDDMRTARFMCCVAIALPKKQLLTAQGSIEGIILKKPRGNGGFGYDPVFLVQDLGETFAELTASQKNMISHRKKALEELLNLLKQYE